MSSRIGVDIGGTFTDLVYYDDGTGTLLVEKVPTTPDSPERGCIAAVRNAVPNHLLKDASYFLHGTTVGLNALLERRGATVGLLGTHGFRDVLEIGRGSRKDPYNLLWAPRAPLVRRALRLSVRERTFADGTIETPVDRSDVENALRVFGESGVSAIAIGFINSYCNAENELSAAKMVRELGFSGAISLSHQVSGEHGEYERISTTVIDAFVRARMASYLSHISTELYGSGFEGRCLLTRSGSGSMSFEEAQERPFETIMSGPVAGAEGAAELSRTFGLGDLITADVGGTSFDTCAIINGQPQLQFEGEIAGLPLKAAWVDVRSIGAGGGSVAYVDAGGGLKVGPRSSGAMPGPACYGRGGSEPCVTDAAFYLGMLGEGHLASGLRLDRKRAEAALESVSVPLNYDAERLARGIIQVVCVSMANAIREITLEQGIDPRRMRLLPFGGAGPLLATQLARELSIDEIVIPPHAGNFSAWGLLGANIVRSASATRFLKLDEHAIAEIGGTAEALFSQLDSRGGRTVDRIGEKKELALDVRYQRQEHTLSISVPVSSNGSPEIDLERVRDAHESAYIRSYGAGLDRPLELVAVRATVRQELPRRKATSHTTAKANSNCMARHMRVASFATGSWQSFAVIDRADLHSGVLARGPAIIHEPTTTTYVDSDFSFAVDENAFLQLRRIA